MCGGCWGRCRQSRMRPTGEWLGGRAACSGGRGCRCRCFSAHAWCSRLQQLVPVPVSCLLTIKHLSLLPPASLAHELYGTTRMLLAVLDRRQLAEVCVVSRWLAVVGKWTTCEEWGWRRPCAAAACRAAANSALLRPAWLHPPATLNHVASLNSPHPTSPPHRAGTVTCGTCWNQCVRCAPSTAGPATTESSCWTCAPSTLSCPTEAPGRLIRLAGNRRACAQPTNWPARLPTCSSLLAGSATAHCPTASQGTTHSPGRFVAARMLRFSLRLPLSGRLDTPARCRSVKHRTVRPSDRNLGRHLCLLATAPDRQQTASPPVYTPAPQHLEISLPPAHPSIAEYPCTLPSFCPIGRSPIYKSWQCSNQQAAPAAAQSCRVEQMPPQYIQVHMGCRSLPTWFPQSAVARHLRQSKGCLNFSLKVIACSVGHLRSGLPAPLWEASGCRPCAAPSRRGRAAAGRRRRLHELGEGIGLGLLRQLIPEGTPCNQSSREQWRGSCVQPQQSSSSLLNCAPAGPMAQQHSQKPSSPPPPAPVAGAPLRVCKQAVVERLLLRLGQLAGGVGVQLPLQLSSLASTGEGGAGKPGELLDPASACPASSLEHTECQTHPHCTRPPARPP